MNYKIGDKFTFTKIDCGECEIHDILPITTYTYVPTQRASSSVTHSIIFNVKSLKQKRSINSELFDNMIQIGDINITICDIDDEFYFDEF